MYFVYVARFHFFINFIVGKDKMEKTFAFSYIKLMKDDGSIIPNGTHELFVYKVQTDRNYTVPVTILYLLLFCTCTVPVTILYLLHVPILYLLHVPVTMLYLLLYLIYLYDHRQRVRSGLTPISI